MENYVNIEGSDSLVRHIDSHAVINKDSNTLKQVLSQREKRKQDTQDLNNLKNDVKDLKTTMNKILDLLEKK